MVTSFASNQAAATWIAFGLSVIALTGSVVSLGAVPSSGASRYRAVAVVIGVLATFTIITSVGVFTSGAQHWIEFGAGVVALTLTALAGGYYVSASSSPRSRRKWTAAPGCPNAFARLPDQNGSPERAPRLPQRGALSFRRNGSRLKPTHDCEKRANCFARAADRPSAAANGPHLGRGAGGNAPPAEDRAARPANPNENPERKERAVNSNYDVIVLGAGAAGEHCAGALAAGGLDVAIVERELVGGECSYYACIPSKTLLRPGEALDATLAAPGATQAIRGHADTAATLAWRDYMISGYDDAGQAKWLQDAGVDVIRGEGQIVEAGVVEVDGRHHGARHIVIATGSEPVIPPIPGLAELEGVWTSRDATGARDIPASIVILGGGPVGVEMAQAFATLGSSADLVEGMDHILPREPRALGEALAEALSGKRLRIHLGRRAASVTRDGTDFVVHFEDGSRLAGQRLLLATGRRPRVAGIGLENVGVEAGHRGIPVDARMNAAEGIWAIGDVTGIWPLTYVGKYHGQIAAANILGEERHADYSAVPRVVFTHPQAVAVGASDGPVTATISLSEVPKTATYMREWDDHPGFLTLISDGDVLTGAYALGPVAGEWMQQATVAVRARVPLSVLSDTIQPFPTFSEAFLFALTKLTSLVPASVS